MNTHISEITAQLVKVFRNENLLQDYNSEGFLYDGVCGWCGVMSPLSRAAYIKSFGILAVEKAEEMARAEIKAAEERRRATHYYAHEQEAAALQGVPAEGGFFFAVSSGMKCDDGRGVFGEIESLLLRTDFEDRPHDREKFEKREPRLCQAREVITVSPEEFDRSELADELVARHGLKGGSATDDVDDGTTWQQLLQDEEARATLYTFGALVTDGTRYFLIDSEGYNYSRYIYVPVTWRDMLRGIVEVERGRIQAQKDAEAKQAADEKAARKAAYEARCNKWAHLMEDVRPLEAKEDEVYQAYKRTGWNGRSPEGKAHTAAKRATDAARKRNILAMCAAAFPGVKFSVSKHKGWGADFTLKWTDGPTKKELLESADIDLFASSWDVFDGMTDCAGKEHAEFIEFSSLTMGTCAGSVKIERIISEEKKAAVIAKIVEVVPDYGECDKYGYRSITVTQEQAEAVADRLGVDSSVLYNYGHFANASQLAQNYCCNTSFYTRQEAVSEPAKPTKDSLPDVDPTAAPADGLWLSEIPGGVAVVGDARTTYRNRREIKAHGATWNKTSQLWEATDAEKVAMLRAWFAIKEQTAETADEAAAETAAEAADGEQKPENVTRLLRVQVVAVARWFSSICEWPTSGILRDTDSIETAGNDSEAVTLWHRLGRPLNRNACVKLFGEDVTAEGEILHNTSDHSARYTEDGDPFAEWWQAVVEQMGQCADTAAEASAEATAEAAAEATAEAGAPSDGQDVAAQEADGSVSAPYRASENSPISDKSGADTLPLSSYFWGLYKFGDIDCNSHEPRLVTAFNTEEEAREWVKKLTDGTWALGVELGDVLVGDGGSWMVWYSHCSGGYYCKFVAHRDDVHDLSDALRRCEALNLRKRLFDFKREHMARQMAKEVAKLHAGEVYAVDYDGDGVTVEHDSANDSRYVVTYWNCDGRKERHTDRTAAEAAQDVADFVLVNIPAKEWISQMLLLHTFKAEDLPYYSGSEKSPESAGDPVADRLLAYKTMADRCGDYSDEYGALYSLARGINFATRGACARKICKILPELRSICESVIDEKDARRRWELDRQLYALAAEVLPTEYFSILYPSEGSTLAYYGFHSQTENMIRLMEEKRRRAAKAPTPDKAEAYA